MSQPTLYASVLHLDRHAIQTLKITDSYSLHRVVYSLFEDVRSESDKQGHTPSGIVYADKGGNRLERQVLILSDREPADGIPADDECLGEVRCKPISPSFLDHPHYQFQVAINPTRRENATGRRLPVKGREAITEWFLERCEPSWGFRTLPATLEVGRVDVDQFKGKQDRDITVAKADLRGVLEVTDAQLFRQSFARGIGRGRAFGCGLLQVVPVLDSPFAEFAK
ncbi:type I-E CRISPR-associated protein Cas6/Cse3/CasE [Halomonas sp. BC04]|uniref:type I-E CRISPR-associated protein Cas6/Cse3/CasE n=1 Tax=Halomonas sp. BC04 TaxID=1403540 RepID=UPI0003ED6E72|nr:type I-E CRISPR-associated protein Cas6/Cse3/CasE [Halomonas sp. BC04]EWH00587.1 CRISPR-associated protein Cse3 [Halomonas sp. BC04]